MSLAENVRAPGNEGEVPFSQRGPAPIETVASFGFWLFLLSDVVMFSGLFAAYAVLADRTAGCHTRSVPAAQNEASVSTIAKPSPAR